MDERYPRKKFLLFLLSLMIAAGVGASNNTPTCQASTGDCTITGFYDYDPKVLEVNILVEPASSGGLTSSVTLPSGISAGQTWPAANAPATCEMSKSCENGGVMQCYANAPCSGGDTQKSLWCGTLNDDTLYGKVYLCAGHDDYGGPTLKKGGPNPPGGSPPPPPGPNPPGPGPDAGTCTQQRFVDHNINNLGKYLMQIEDRTPTRNKQFTVLDRGGHRSLSTIINDGNIIDTTNSVFADAEEVIRIRKQGDSSLIALEGIGWLSINPMMAAAVGGASEAGTPAQFALRLPWNRYTGMMQCPRSATNTPQDRCHVFSTPDAANFYVHAQSCKLETVSMRNDNGPLLAQIYHLFDDFKLDAVQPVRQLSINPFADQEAHRKMSEGKGTPSLYHSLATPGAGIAPR
ncbi:MAG: hypothetical protein AAF513_20310 [Pseudomonadota bacterium]